VYLVGDLDQWIESYFEDPAQIVRQIQTKEADDGSVEPQPSAAEQEAPASHQDSEFAPV
jgi:hypothetical protein